MHLEDLDEEGLHQPVLAQDAEGEPAAGGGQFHALPRPVDGEAVGGERLDHGGDGAGHDGQRRGERAHRDEPVGLLREQQEVLEVVLHRDAGHGTRGKQDI